MTSPFTVKIYTTPDCQYCRQVKDYLDAAQQPYTEIDTTNNLMAIDTVQQLTGSLMVPVTIVSAADRSDMVIVGYDPQKLAIALKGAL